MSTPNVGLSINAVLAAAGYEGGPAKPFHGKPIYRDGKFIGRFNVQTIWSLPGMIEALERISPADVALVCASNGIERPALAA